jgi:pimeloyl-ACP methyl ester carboxylesterase
VGDYVTFERPGQLLNGGRLFTGKAVDDRVGVAVMIEVMRQLRDNDLETNGHAVATIQEEVGIRGAGPAAFRVKSDAALAIDVTLAEPLLRSLENLDGNVVYETMNGPNEFYVIGNLKEWDRTDRLGEIEVPTLITVGRYDEITPACAETIHRGIQGSRLRIFEQSGHVAHLKKTNACLRTVADFLAQAEAGPSP